MDHPLIPNMVGIAHLLDKSAMVQLLLLVEEELQYEHVASLVV